MTLSECHPIDMPTMPAPITAMDGPGGRMLPYSSCFLNGLQFSCALLHNLQKGLCRMTKRTPTRINKADGPLQL